MNKFLTVFFLIFFLSAEGQFSKITDFDKASLSCQFRSILYDNGKIICSGDFIDTVDTNRGYALISRYDLFGNFQQYSYYRPDSVYDLQTFQNSLIKTNDNTYVSVGLKGDSGIIGVLIQFDSNFTATKYLEYPIPGSQGHILNFVQQVNSDYIITSNYAFNYDPKVQIMRVDSNGNIKWQKRFYTANSFGDYAAGMIINRDGNIVVSANSMRHNQITNTYQSRTDFMILDPDSNVLLNKYGADLNGGYANSVQQTPDGGYVTCGNKILLKDQWQGTWGKSCVAKWDSVFNLQWIKLIGDSLILEGCGLNTIKIARNSDFLACGKGYNYDYNNDNSFYNYGSIIRLSQDGNVKWIRAYRSRKSSDLSSEESNLFDLEELPDGRIVACGLAKGNEPGEILQKAWILMLDSNGCLLDSCGLLYNDIEEVSLESNDQNQDKLVIYPNPTDNYLYFDIHSNSPSANYSVIVTDVQGREIDKVDFVSEEAEYFYRCSNLPSGIYLISLYQNGKKVKIEKFVRE